MDEDAGTQSQYGVASPGMDGMDGYTQPDELGEDDITQEDCWDIIRAFFDEKGLVRQQLDSFNDFLGTTMQELVYEVGQLTLEQAKQYTGQNDDHTVSFYRCGGAPLLMLMMDDAHRFGMRSNLVRSTRLGPSRPKMMEHKQPCIRRMLVCET